MAYRIEYGSQGSVRMPVKGSRGKRRFRAAALVGLVLLGVLMVPKGRELVRDAVLPGDSAVTAEALQKLALDLQEGEKLPDAVTAFCQHIITESGS